MSKIKGQACGECAAVLVNSDFSAWCIYNGVSDLERDRRLRAVDVLGWVYVDTEPGQFEDHILCTICSVPSNVTRKGMYALLAS